MITDSQTTMLLISEEQLKKIVVLAVSVAVKDVMKEARELYEAEHSKNATIKASEVTERYGISSTTLWRWNTSGILKPIKVGSQNRYFVEDVERVMRGEKA